MKLLIATGIYPPDIGGPATYSKKIAEEFAKRGWDVVVLTYANLRECEHEYTQSFKVIKVSRAHNVIMRYFLYTWNLIKLAKKADLIYAQGTVSEGLPVYFASKLTGKKYVLKVVGDPAWERWWTRKQDLSAQAENKKTRPVCAGRKQYVETRFIASGNDFIDLEEFQVMRNLPVKTKFLRCVERFVARNAEKIITPSQYLRKIVEMWGVDASKIKVIYNTVEEKIKKVDDLQGEIKKFRNLEIGKSVGENGVVSQNSVGIRNMAVGVQNFEPLREDVILSVGRLVSWKGFDMLIDLMPELLKVNPNFKLVIVGNGQEHERLKFQISNFKFQKLDDKIILTGKLEHKKVVEYMKKSKMFVLNSGYEGLPHVVIEAMQAGLPCVVSNKGGNPELVENEKTGLLFEYNNRDEIKNAIIRLWEDENLRERVAVGGREKVKAFSYERMTGETMEILNYKSIRQANGLPRACRGGKL